MTEEDLYKYKENWYEKYKMLESQLIKKDKQIDKMKCCTNCNCYHKTTPHRCNGCHNFSHWKLKE